MSNQQNNSSPKFALGFLLKKKVMLYVLPFLLIFLLPMCGLMNDPTVPPYSAENINIFMEVSTETGVPLVDLMVYHFVREEDEVNRSTIRKLANKFKYENSYEETYKECTKDKNGKETCVNKKKKVTYESIYSLTERLEMDGFDQETINKALELHQAWSMRLGGGSSIGLLPGACVGNLSANGKAKANAKVQSYHNTIEKYAKQFGMEPYIEIMKAMMMQETKGEGLDPMQSSESSDFNKKYPTRPGGITDPDYSIYVGVQTFRKAIEISNYDIMTALQTYNFGPYFATWIKSHGGTYTLEIAQKYSTEVLQPQHGISGTPQHAIKVASYYEDAGCETGGSGSPSVVGANGWAWPTQSTRITDTFISTAAFRFGQVHGAVDVGAMKPGVKGDPIWTMADGVVSYTGLITGGGNSVFVDHGNGVVSRYIHMNSINVKNGQVVKKGQIVGTMGGSGGTRTTLNPNAYAVHLDFQIKLNGTPVDPLKFFPNIKP